MAAVSSSPQPSSVAPLFVGVEEAARLLGISRSLAYTLANLWLTTGEAGLPAIRLGRRILVKRVAVEEWAVVNPQH